jgi:protein-tyrosine phosphatase
MAEWMLQQGFVHFLATDAHGPKSRRPLMRRAFERTVQLVGEQIAVDLCCRNPAAVVEGQDIKILRYKPKSRSFLSSLFKRDKAA